MSTDKPLQTFNVSPEQEAAINAAVQAAGMSKTAFLRLACALACQQYGIEWPENMPGHGGKRVRGIDKDTP